MFSVIKTKFALGAFIEGLDLSNPLSEKQFNQLYEALCENEVLFFRNQNLSHENHKQFASMFGQMQTHPAYPTVSNYLSLIHISEPTRPY